MTKEPTPESEAMLFGNRFVTEDAPDGPFPPLGMPAMDAMRLVGEEILLDGLTRMRNLATFVTTWIEPEAVRLITERYTNFIDHAEYPKTAEIGRAASACSPTSTRPRRDHRRARAGLLRGDHARALSLKWKWASAARPPASRSSCPTVFGGDVHVVWEKFCRYFDVEPRMCRWSPEVHDRSRGRRARR